jgi:hypothetical protein
MAVKNKGKLSQFVYEKQGNSKFTNKKKTTVYARILCKQFRRLANAYYVWKWIFACITLRFHIC